MSAFFEHFLHICYYLIMCMHVLRPWFCNGMVNSFCGKYFCYEMELSSLDSRPTRRRVRRIRCRQKSCWLTTPPPRPPTSVRHSDEWQATMPQTHFHIEPFLFLFSKRHPCLHSDLAQWPASPPPAREWHCTSDLTGFLNFFRESRDPVCLPSTSLTNKVTWKLGSRV